MRKAVGKQTNKYYATEAGATAALASYKSTTRVRVKRDARQALVGKRVTEVWRLWFPRATDRRGDGHPAVAPNRFERFF